MKFPGTGLLRQWRASSAFSGLATEQRAIVFYAEDGASYPHFHCILQELTDRLGRDVCYLTSSDADPILANTNPRLRTFYVGGGSISTWTFLNMHAGVVVMTLPELQTHYIKRSRVHEVHYAYVFHSIVSTHMIYREGAFDHYDSLFCVGPHHIEEIRAREARQELLAKSLIEVGSGRLDELLESAAALAPRSGRSDGSRLRVLVAPSWGKNGLIETRGADLTGILLDAGFQVTVRPHPMTGRQWPNSIRAIEDKFRSCDSFVLEWNIASRESLETADIMISDWSGAALEFAFAFERPVVFVDVPAKINNPNYGDLDIEPVERSIREEIGVVVPTDALADVPSHIERLCANPEAYGERIRAARDRTVFNPRSSGRVGAEHIAKLADAWLEDPHAGSALRQ